MPTKQNPTWNLAKSLQHLNSHAHRESKRKCARYVANAIDAGGLTVDRKDAFMLGESLIKIGFIALDASPAEAMPGDVVVFDRIPLSHPFGHTAMYDGTQWVSDFVQPHFYVSDAYRRYNKYKFYRYQPPSLAP